MGLRTFIRYRLGLLALMLPLCTAQSCGQGANEASTTTSRPTPPPRFTDAEADSVLSELDARAETPLEFFAIAPLELLRSQDYTLSLQLNRRARLELIRFQDTTRFSSPGPNVLDFKYTDSLRLRIVVFEQNPRFAVVGIQADENPDSTGCGFTSAELLHYDYHTWVRVSGDAFPQPIFTEEFLPDGTDRTACGHTLLHHGDVMRRFTAQGGTELFLPCQYESGSPPELPTGVQGDVKPYPFRRQNHGFGITWP